MTDKRQPIWPGLDHIANFLNALDSADMTAKDVRGAIYGECLAPTVVEQIVPVDGSEL